MNRTLRSIPAGAVSEVARRDRQAARLLTATPLRLTTLVAVGVAGWALWASVGYRPVFGVVLLVSAGAAVWATTFRQRPSRRGGDGGQLFGGAAGVGLHVGGIVVAATVMPVLLLSATDVDVRVFTPLFVFVVVGVLFTAPWRWRWPLAALMVVSLAVTLWGAGERGLPELVLQVGGAVMAFAATVRISGTLSNAALAADRARDAADLRAGLLGSLLGTTSLEPAQVLRATVDGLLEVGFEAASIRRLDHEAQEAVLIEGVARGEVSVPRSLPFDGTVIPDVVREGRRLVVAEVGRDPRTEGMPHASGGAVFLPLFADDRVDTIVAGVRAHGPVGDEQLAAAELLAAQADGALQRARTYEQEEDTLAELQQVDRRIQDFVSTLSHELRTPLTVIHGLGRTLTERWFELDESVRRDLLRRIDGNAERLATMLTSLLDTSAWEAGELRVSARPVPLRSLIDEVVHRAAGLTSRHPVRIEVPRQLVVHADPALLSHVVENLFANVEKHTPAGTRVSVRAAIVEEGEVSSGVRVVRVEVADDGPGIAPEDLPHVLDRFYRGGQVDTRATSGLGLGLALAQDIVQAHGGRLTVDSTPGGGTSFRFTVAAVEDPPGP